MKYNFTKMFLDPDTGIGGGEPVNENVSENNNEAEKNGKGKETSIKTFTQEQVNAMMAREKREGKNSVLKSLGFENEEDAKKAFNLLKALTDSQKTEEDKLKEKNNDVSEEKNEAIKRAELAEAKVSCLMAGVNKESIEDVITIALTKVDEKKDLDKVLEYMKKEKRYSMFFNQESEGGTGNPPGHSGTGNQKDGDYGKRLGEMNKNNKKGVESKYFS